MCHIILSLPLHLLLSGINQNGEPWQFCQRSCCLFLYTLSSSVSQQPSHTPSEWLDMLGILLLTLLPSLPSSSLHSHCLLLKDQRCCLLGSACHFLSTVITWLSPECRVLSPCFYLFFFKNFNILRGSLLLICFDSFQDSPQLILPIWSQIIYLLAH